MEGKSAFAEKSFREAEKTVDNRVELRYNNKAVRERSKSFRRKQHVGS